MGGFRQFRRSSIEDVPAASDSQKEKGGDGGCERRGTHAPLGRHRLRLIGWRRRKNRARLHRLPDFERVDVDRLGDVLELGSAEIGHLEVEPSLHLPVGLFGEADRAGFRDAL